MALPPKRRGGPSFGIALSTVSSNLAPQAAPAPADAVPALKAALGGFICLRDVLIGEGHWDAADHVSNVIDNVEQSTQRQQNLRPMNSYGVAGGGTMFSPDSTPNRMTTKATMRDLEEGGHPFTAQGLIDYAHGHLVAGIRALPPAHPLIGKTTKAMAELSRAVPGVDAYEDEQRGTRELLARLTAEVEDLKTRQAALPAPFIDDDFVDPPA